MTGPPIESDAAEVERLRSARAQVLARITDACARAGRDPGAVTLVAVSKTVPPGRIAAAAAAGYDVFGENRVQEAETKLTAAPDAAWHLVGPLQSNKVRRALLAFETIESVDSVELAVRLDRLAAEVRPAAPVPILLQVNVDEDAAKAGFDPAELEGALEAVLALSRLEVRGLMTIGRLVARPEDARSTFIGLRDVSERLRRSHPRLGPELSMGMSEDYPIAVEEGATIVRVGRALFGERPHDHDHPAAADHAHDHG
ncbi:MAG TPA: YggS family pyridoxal phosphate-dependent enzyme [Candidatus Limnocylindrales bacterium]|nr:YggS family pyridoxal phosphate-dependent enzyme [Candidatus Limnocylindrales bacterium]